MKKIQINSLIAGFLVLGIISLIFFMIENGIFWRRVSEVRMLTGADSSFEVGKKVVREPKIIAMSFLLLCIKYSIATTVLVKGTRNFLIFNSVVFGLLAVLLTNIVRPFWNVKAIINYPLMTSLEAGATLTVCITVGIVAQLLSKKTNAAT